MSIIRITILVFIGIFTIHFNGCGSPVTSNVTDKVKEFEKITNRKTNSTLRFADLKGKTIGICFYGVKQIYLDKTYYDRASEIERKALIFHELGHCECLSGHVEEESPMTFCPKSIMYPSASSEWCYRTRWQSYMKDLRKICRK